MAFHDATRCPSLAAGGREGTEKPGPFRAFFTASACTRRATPDRHRCRRTVVRVVHALTIAMTRAARRLMGASRTDVLGIVLRQGMRPALVGMLLGAAGAW